jgi:hypothetical protein
MSLVRGFEGIAMKLGKRRLVSSKDIKFYGFGLNYTFPRLDSCCTQL